MRPELKRHSQESTTRALARRGFPFVHPHGILKARCGLPAPPATAVHTRNAAQTADGIVAFYSASTTPTQTHAHPNHCDGSPHEPDHRRCIPARRAMTTTRGLTGLVSTVASIRDTAGGGGDCDNLQLLS